MNQIFETTPWFDAWLVAHPQYPAIQVALAGGLSLLMLLWLWWESSGHPQQ